MSVTSTGWRLEWSKSKLCIIVKWDQSYVEVLLHHWEGSSQQEVWWPPPTTHKDISTFWWLADVILFPIMYNMWGLTWFWDDLKALYWKYWSDDGRTDRSSTWRLDPWNRYMAPSALPQAWFSPKFQKSTIDQACAIFLVQGSPWQCCRVSDMQIHKHKYKYKYANTQIQLRWNLPRDPTHVIFFESPWYDDHEYNGDGSLSYTSVHTVQMNVACGLSVASGFLT